MTYQHIDALDNVQEHLVLPVPDTLRSPRDCVGDGHWRSDLHLEFVRLLGDVLLEDLALGGLGESKVHHLIHEFVDDNKVISNTLFFQLLEVFDQNLGESMEEDDDL